MPTPNGPSPPHSPQPESVELQLLRKKLDQTMRSMRLLEEAKDRYDALYNHAIIHLAESLELNQRLLSAAPMGIAAYHAASGRCVEANAAMAAILGVAQEQLRKLDFWELPAWKAERIRDAALVALETGEDQQVEVEISGAGGKALWIACVLTTFTSRSERHLLAMVIDHTKRHQAEEAQRHAQKMESMALMAGSIAHDFNNAFQVILNCLEMLRNGRLEPEVQQTALGRALESLGRAQTMSGRMLDYSGKGLRQTLPLDLAEFIAGQQKAFEDLAGVPVAVETQDSELAPVVLGDPEQLFQALAALVVNAREAFTTGPTAIRIRLATAERQSGSGEGFWVAAPPKGPCAVVSVEDSGTGIAPEILGRVFDPFFTTKETGRGLGLPVALGILKAHQAGLQVHSVPGKGSQFRAVFPLASRPVQAPAPTLQAGPHRHQETILVVDDDPVIRDVCAEILQSLFGYRTLTAKDGLEAVDVFGRHQDDIALVLMDATMPRLGGEAAFDRIQAIRPGAKAILCSGFSESFGAEVMLHHGFLAFLKKPYSIEELRAALEKALARHPGQ
jgi:PAS domain S-box-containing protein